MKALSLENFVSLILRVYKFVSFGKNYANYYLLSRFEFFKESFFK
jgi:hypothetical protein